MKNRRGFPSGREYSLLALALLVTLLCAYIGGYCVLVEKRIFEFYFDRTSHYIPIAEYRFGGEFARAFFTPIHSIDRRGRRAFWDSAPPPKTWPSIMELEAAARRDADARRVSGEPEGLGQVSPGRTSVASDALGRRGRTQKAR